MNPVFNALLASVFFFCISMPIMSNDKQCSFKGPQKIVSLSGPFTHTLQAFGLLNDTHLVAVGDYQGIEEGRFQTEIIKGGVFVAPKTLEKFKGHIVFYDESFHLKDSLSKIPSINAIAIESRHKTPFEVIDSTLRFLLPLVENCEHTVKKINDDLSQLKQKYLNLSSKTNEKAMPMLFFLGPLNKNKKFPPLIMLYDGAVKFLLENKVIISYPSKLSYVSWAEKELKAFSKKYPQAYWVGLETQKETSYVTDAKIINIKGNILLTPGFGQIGFLSILYENIFNKSRK